MTNQHTGRARALGACAWIALVVGMATGVRAQAITGAPMMNFPLGVRSEGMGQTGTADAWDPQNIYFNPANVTAVEGVYGAGSYMLANPYLSNQLWFGHGSLGGGRTFGGQRPIRFAADLTFARLSYGTVTVTNTYGLPVGQVDAKEEAMGLTVGASTTFENGVRVSAGLAAKRWVADYGKELFEDPDSASFSANMFDAGVVVSTVLDAGDWRLQPAVGLAGVNLGSDIETPYQQNDPLPSWFKYGASMRVVGPEVALGSATVPAVSATLNIDGIHGLNEQRPKWGFGSEVAFMDAVFVRWGRRVDDHDRNAVSTWGVALGVPVRQFRARLEYANYAAPYPGFVPIVHDKFGATVVWLFEGSGEE